MVPRWGPRTIRARILVWTLGVSLVPLGSFVVQEYRTGRNALEESAKERVQAVASSRLAWVRSWITERLTDMAVIGQSRDCVDLVRRTHGHPSVETVCEYLESFCAQTEAYESIELYDPQWNLVATAGGQRHEPVGSIEHEFREKLARGGEPAWGRVHQHEDGKLGLHVGNLVRDPDGEHVGFVIANLELSTALEPILRAREGLGETGIVRIISGDGEVLAGPVRREEAIPREVRPDVASAFIPSGIDTTALYLTTSGKEVVGGWAWMPKHDWSLVAEIDASEALGWILVLKRHTVQIGAAVTLIVLFFSLYMARQLSLPLRRLASTASRIAAGNHGERVWIEDPTEMGRVGIAFNQMLDFLEVAHERRIQAESLAAVGTLSSSIAHEMRNPLSSIKMNLQALLQRVREDPAHSELAAIALRQVVRVEGMLHELLNYSKPIHLEPRPLALGRLVRDVIRDVRRDTDSQHVGIRLRDRTDGKTVSMDRERGHQVLGNLIENALHASTDGGEVTVTVDVESPSGQDMCRIVVSDSGPGIPEENLSRVFQPFFTTKERGVGLGLAIVKKIVDCHGGFIRARNLPDGGAELEVVLPVEIVARRSEDSR